VLAPFTQEASHSEIKGSDQNQKDITHFLPQQSKEGDNSKPSTLTQAYKSDNRKELQSSSTVPSYRQDILHD